MTAKDFGLKVREYRVLRGLGQEDLAQRIGKSVATISRIENGTHNIGIFDMLALAVTLNVPMRELFDNEDMIRLSSEKTDTMVAIMRAYNRLPVPLLQRILALAQEIEHMRECQTVSVS